MNARLSTAVQTALQAIEQEASFLSCEIELSDGRVLDSSIFRLVSFEGTENVSESFEFTLTLHGDTDLSSRPLFFSELLGRPINIFIRIPDFPDEPGANVVIQADKQDRKRRNSVFNGIVASFGMQEPGVYRLIMRPALWRMTLTNHYRVFQKMNIRDALYALCREHRLSANFDALEHLGSLAISRVQDWLQAGESDYEFMCRLMNKAHIHFYFIHQYKRHTLFFSNYPNYPKVYENDRSLRYVWTNSEEISLHQTDVIAQYSFQQSLTSNGVRGVFTTEEQAANTDERIASYASYISHVSDSEHRPQNTDNLVFNQYRIYQYGGSLSEAHEYAQASYGALQAASSQLTGVSYCPLFRAGHQFSLSANGQPIRPSLEQINFVLIQISHKASLEGEYTNQFLAYDASGLITPISLADTQQSMLLAKVVAYSRLDSPGSWPYYTPDNFDMQHKDLQDADGVEKQMKGKGVYVRFSTEDENSAPVWVKLPPYMQAVPEIGTMVIVSRANDESELPEIQNVHADGAMVVTPSDWTAHTHVGNNFSTSYGDGKNVRFGQCWSSEDTSKAVGIVEKAYDSKKFRESSYSRGANYSYSCSENMAEGILGESWSYGSSYSNTWAKENKSFSAAGRCYHESITGDYDNSIGSTESIDKEAIAAVQASKNSVVGNTYNYNENKGNSKSVSIHNGNTETRSTHHGNVKNISKQTGQVLSVNRHTGVTNNISVTLGGSNNFSTVIGECVNYSNHTGVLNTSITGMQVSSNLLGLSSSVDVIGVSNSNSMTGIRTHASMTGAAVDANLSGAVTSESISGTATSMSVTGMSNSVSVTGTHSSVNMVGSSSSIDITGGGIALSVSNVTSIRIHGSEISIPLIQLVI